MGRCVNFIFYLKCTLSYILRTYARRFLIEMHGSKDLPREIKWSEKPVETEKYYQYKLSLIKYLAIWQRCSLGKFKRIMEKQCKWHAKIQFLHSKQYANFVIWNINVQCTVPTEPDFVGRYLKIDILRTFKMQLFGICLLFFPQPRLFNQNKIFA